jgi:hypothetical protein
MAPENVQKIVLTALECSFYHAPSEPGLTYNELLEVGSRVDLRPGEISDALPHTTGPIEGFKPERLLPGQGVTARWKMFVRGPQPEYRNFAAFDLLFSTMNSRIRQDGGQRAQLHRDAVVEKAVAANIPKQDIEASITISVASGMMKEHDGILKSVSRAVYEPLPSVQRQTYPLMGRGQPDELRKQIHAIVGDVVQRRIDGRPKQLEPLDAFAEALTPLGYGKFGLWWTQIVAELKQANPASSPLSCFVLSAALIEGALTFVAAHARSQNLGVFKLPDFDRDPGAWKIDDLVKSAASGNQDAILDESSRLRVSQLVQTRQRIHAGRMLSEYPSGVPDLRPEEARDAKATAEIVVRKVLDWLHSHP